MELIDLLAPLLLLADFACRELARRINRAASPPLSGASPERAWPQSVPTGVRVFPGIYVRDDSEY